MKLILGSHLFKVQHKTYVFATGISSLCDDGKHVLFLDFDSANLSKVEACLRILQHKFGIGTFYVFRTDKDAYHAICLDKFSAREILWIQDFIGVDKNFTALCYRRGYWTLRVSGKGGRPKPKYILALLRKSQRSQSSAHARWLSLYTGKAIIGTDGLQNVHFDQYATFRQHPRIEPEIRF